jgi:hypothetical protein
LCRQEKPIYFVKLSGKGDRDKKAAGDDDVPLLGASHAPTATSDSMLSSQNVCESSVITPASHLHYTVNIEPIHVIIHRLTAKIFPHCPSHPNPLVQQTGNYTLADLTNMQKT